MGDPVKNEDVTRKDGFYIKADLVGTQPATAANYGVIFTALRPCELIAVMKRQEVAGSAGTPTLQIEKLLTGVAPGSGTDVLVTGYDLRLTAPLAANTTETKQGTALASTLTSDGASCRLLAPGESFALKDSGTLTSVAGLHVTLYLKFTGRGDYF